MVACGRHPRWVNVHKGAGSRIREIQGRISAGRGSGRAHPAVVWRLVATPRRPRCEISGAGGPIRVRTCLLGLCAIDMCNCRVFLTSVVGFWAHAAKLQTRGAAGWAGEYHALGGIFNSVFNGLSL